MVVTAKALITGVSFVAAGCLLNSFSMVGIKASADHEADRPIFKRWRWMLSLCCMVAATPASVVAMGMLPLSLIAPFAGLTIVFSLLLAASGVFSEAEHMSLTDAACVLLVLMGVTGVAIYGPHSSTEPTHEQILENFTQPLFRIFSAATLVPVLLWLPLACAANPTVVSAPEDIELEEVVVLPESQLGKKEASSSAVNAASTMTVRERQRCVELHARLAQSPVLLTVCSGYASAACGSLSQLFLKVVSVSLNELGRVLKGSGGGGAEGGGGARIAGGADSGGQPPLTFAESSWAHPPVWLALAGLVVTAPLQLFLLDRLLAGSSVTAAVPVYQSLLILLTSAAGGIFFREFSTMESGSTVLYACGMVMAISGIAILSRSNAASGRDERIPSSDEEMTDDDGGSTTSPRLDGLADSQAASDADPDTPTKRAFGMHASPSSMTLDAALSDDVVAPPHRRDSVGRSPPLPGHPAHPAQLRHKRRSIRDSSVFALTNAAAWRWAVTPIVAVPESPSLPASPGGGGRFGRQRSETINLLPFRGDRESGGELSPMAQAALEANSPGRSPRRRSVG